MRMKRRIRTDVCLILCGILVWFLADARQLRLEAAKALTLCAGTVIPALFPFMVITGLLVRLGFGQWLAPDMAGLMASLFRLPGCAGSALLLGLVGGYPIGARTAAELFDLPVDVVAGLPRLELIGNRQLYLERHTGLLAYSDTQIDANTGFGVLRIRGERLTLVAMTGEELRIGGKINGVEWVSC